MQEPADVQMAPSITIQSKAGQQPVLKEGDEIIGGDEDSNEEGGAETPQQANTAPRDYSDNHQQEEMSHSHNNQSSASH